ncbi:metal-dependent hydrolase [Thermoproteota archaeon]
MAYFTYKLLQKFIKNDANFLFLAIFSMLPDVDFLIPFLRHRGSTHSLSAILFLLFFTIFFTRLVPYLAAFSSHILIGDLFTAYGVRLFWPLSKEFYVIPISFLGGWNQLLIEFTLFFFSILLFFYTQDYKRV